ncbi:MAG: hypothetical protein BWK78_00435 [Thiotrichaceae bacterium IS1]|nr:MAG: hypothetical protein BWK78_00435 [Thiotrichaceae bacterium IS1]
MQVGSLLFNAIFSADTRDFLRTISEAADEVGGFGRLLVATGTAGVAVFDRLTNSGSGLGKILITGNLGAYADQFKEIGEFAFAVDDAVDEYIFFISKVGAVAGAVAAAFGASAIGAIAETQQINSRLQALTSSAEAYKETQQYLQQTANTLSTDLNVLSDSYAKLLNLEQSGIVTTGEARTVLEGLSNVAAMTGASTQQLESSLFGLAQGLSAGKLQAEEFSQITEPLPGLTQALDEAAGVAAGGFKRMVNDGQVSSEMLKTTLITALESYSGAAEAMGGNITQTFTRLENAYRSLQVSFESPLSGTVTPVAEGFISILNTMSTEINNSVTSGNAFFDFLTTTSNEIKDFLQGIAQALPAALQLVDFSGLVSALELFKETIRSAFDIDLTAPEGLARVIQLLISVITTMINTVSGYVAGMSPFINMAFSAAEALSSFAESGGYAAGYVASFTEALSLLTPVLGAIAVGALVAGFIYLQTALSGNIVALLALRLATMTTLPIVSMLAGVLTSLGPVGYVIIGLTYVFMKFQEQIMAFISELPMAEIALAALAAGIIYLQIAGVPALGMFGTALLAVGTAIKSFILALGPVGIAVLGAIAVYEGATYAVNQYRDSLLQAIAVEAAAAQSALDERLKKVSEATGIAINSLDDFNNLVKDGTLIYNEQSAAWEVNTESLYAYNQEIGKLEPELKRQQNALDQLYKQQEEGQVEAAKEAVEKMLQGKTAYNIETVRQAKLSSDELIKIEQDLTQKVIDLQQSILNERRSTEDEIRALRRNKMSEAGQQADIELEINEKLQKAQEALAAGDTEAAKAFAEQVKNLSGQLKDSDRAIEGLQKGSDVVLAALEKSKVAAEQFREEVGKEGKAEQVKIEADISQAESAVSQLKSQLDELKDKVVKIKVQQEGNASAGGGQGFQSGGQLSGYGGGDRIPALLEAGEYIINKQSARKFSGLLNVLNFKPHRLLRLLPDLPKFALGGPVNLPIPSIPSLQPVAFAAGGSTETINFNWQIGQKQGQMKTLMSQRQELRGFVEAIYALKKGL